MKERGEGQKFLNKKSLALEHICNQIDRTTHMSKLLKSFFEKPGSESYFRTMRKCHCCVWNLENFHSQRIKTLEKTVLSHHQGMHANYKSFTYSHIPALRLVWHVRNIMSEIFDEDSRQYCKNVFRSFKSNCNLCTLNKKMLSFSFLFYSFSFLMVLIFFQNEQDKYNLSM